MEEIFDTVTIDNYSRIKEETTPREERWRLSEDMIAALVRHLLEFKKGEDADRNDFEGDLICLYSELRKSMAEDHVSVYYNQ